MKIDTIKRLIRYGIGGAAVLWPCIVQAAEIDPTSAVTALFDVKMAVSCYVAFCVWDAGAAGAAAGIGKLTRTKKEGEK